MIQTAGIAARTRSKAAIRCIDEASVGTTGKGLQMDSMKNLARLAADPAGWLLALVVGILGSIVYVVLTSITF